MALPTTKVRPTITLALIVKNEEKNIARLLDSVEGCFDQIVLVDTGSTDKTKEIAEKYGCQIFDFEWVNSFCKARNFAFSKATCEFVMWMDADDVLSDKKAFIQWRDYAMEFVDCWFATYHYALDKEGTPIVSFVRERVFRRSVNPTWKYDLHEGVVALPEWSKNYITAWTVNHLRDQEDIRADKSRNLTILEQMKDIDTRMLFYYGKELYEGNRYFEALPMLEKASNKEDIEPHDRLLALQYGAYAAMACGQALKEDRSEERLAYFNRAIELGHKGLKLDPHRAEFYVSIADSLVQSGRLKESIPFFSAAKSCINSKEAGSPYEGAIYSFVNYYGELPSLQLAKVYFNLGALDKAKSEALVCANVYNNQEAKTILGEIERISTLVELDNNQQEVGDIVFSCPPQTAYSFDEEIYKTKPLGGSETALVSMAKLLKEKTGRRVIVFNMRDQDLVATSGVEYLSNRRLNEYFSKYKPKIHIAWRHNIRVTNSATLLWCHDLFTPGVEGQRNFDKILCLSDFHKNYVMGLQGVPESEIIVTRNGIAPEKFPKERKKKNENKIVWMSSPDRGLDRCIRVLDEVIKDHPNIELHVYYGIEGLYKYGPQMSALADHLKQLMADRPWVKYHGFTEQNKMYDDVSDAAIWLHPCNFIETFCITALEMLALGVYPVTRKLGALANTLADAESKGQATLLPHDCVTHTEIMAYADEVRAALKDKKWEQVSLDLNHHSWERISEEWLKFMEL